MVAELHKREKSAKVGNFDFRSHRSASTEVLQSLHKDTNHYIISR